MKHHASGDLAWDKIQSGAFFGLQMEMLPFSLATSFEGMTHSLRAPVIDIEFVPIHLDP